MRTKWEKPLLYIEGFELSQHYAAACKDPVTKVDNVTVGCVHGDKGHNWTIENMFTSTISNCMIKCDSIDEIVSTTKELYSKDGSINSWGSGIHMIALPQYDITTMFTSV